MRLNRGGICAAFSSDYEVNQMLEVADISDVDTPYLINDSYGEGLPSGLGKGVVLHNIYSKWVDA